ncbi:hypothetical protein MPTK1_4g18100 [Marchantia polymorpha subsp. ruderalis]|uniref:Uncharacterized protein n=2 Tax=Marchantia polymorpha TaxID=3197 RepID=A0AAF6BB50_MARPO|nr:hypothetical protein MARPO_0041s0091 [Marchantia polymorpha]BBN09234.1 hypothetical protein Mp_4g18100 [Marchantia polymorpha subsp. ruderalis]PTQ40223.1 hypothetical protein MARPO_0041s0091 [Marchantia polymorpha]PTQ40224.1 hypothetical protein MARPO_0041s0091 [Marchantia polymorpha]BBN09235.1 hypothetical protein Mp_4g18100 [Marchantia polymorpha subsp. ruderalis]|eukprot:PTQ40222.1 hypothetical protein MARPO_0041s0091 [Marchantia polymorpha]
MPPSLPPSLAGNLELNDHQHNKRANQSNNRTADEQQQTTDYALSFPRSLHSYPTEVLGVEMRRKKVPRSKQKGAPGRQDSSSFDEVRETQTETETGGTGRSEKAP